MTTYIVMWSFQLLHHLFLMTQIETGTITHFCTKQFHFLMHSAFDQHIKVAYLHQSLISVEASTLLYVDRVFCGTMLDQANRNESRRLFASLWLHVLSLSDAVWQYNSMTNETYPSWFQCQQNFNQSVHSYMLSSPVCFIDFCHCHS